MEAKSEIQGLKSHVKDRFNSMIDKEQWYLEAHEAYRAANVTDRTFIRDAKTLIDEDRVFDGTRIEMSQNETIQSFLIKIKEMYNINESQRIMDIYSGVGLKNHIQKALRARKKLAPQCCRPSKCVYHQSAPPPATLPPSLDQT